MSFKFHQLILKIFGGMAKEEREGKGSSVFFYLLYFNSLCFSLHIYPFMTQMQKINLQAFVPGENFSTSTACLPVCSPIICVIEQKEQVQVSGHSPLIFCHQGHREVWGSLYFPQASNLFMCGKRLEDSVPCSNGLANARFVGGQK